MRDLNDLDQKIERLPDAVNDTFRFQIYRLTEKNEQKHFAIQYADEPLKTLREIRELKDAHAVTKDKNFEKEVKLLYRTLSQILQDSPGQALEGMCLLVLIKAKDRDDLQNGGLVKCIMNAVTRPKSTQEDGSRRLTK